METGVSNGVLDKKGSYSLDTIEKIITVYPEINLEWLLTGDGLMMGNFPTSGVHNSFPACPDTSGKVLLHLSALSTELAQSNTALLRSHGKLLEIIRGMERQELKGRGGVRPPVCP
ncbi:MAG: hypothetical protein LBN98_04630 [Prevotellaceae bacterium]|nr:hypothetical protein [Prevotellaceae bacterium]